MCLQIIVGGLWHLHRLPERRAGERHPWRPAGSALWASLLQPRPSQVHLRYAFWSGVLVRRYLRPHAHGGDVLPGNRHRRLPAVQHRNGHRAEPVRHADHGGVQAGKRGDGVWAGGLCGRVWLAHPVATRQPGHHCNSPRGRVPRPVCGRQRWRVRWLGAVHSWVSSTLTARLCNAATSCPRFPGCLLHGGATTLAGCVLLRCYVARLPHVWPLSCACGFGVCGGVVHVLHGILHTHHLARPSPG